ncbi:MAG: NAD(P)H-dependent flavin oxidoreductase [Candidatus Jordarchaeum sp.]|uniref:NAD(P)H-dependent flavin oxidoreductase n=1 Tax=Candidatus Jordarchaeum sp. TaxID=2823881 RepID=UPI00404B8DA0
MIKTKLTEMLEIKYPIIQAGMGPHNTTNLAAAVANSGGLGLISGIGMGYLAFMEKPLFGFTEKTPRKQMLRSIETVKNMTKESGGVFGINVPVAVEFQSISRELIEAGLEARETDNEVKKRMKVIVTSAGNPEPFVESIKESGAYHFHVCPSPYHAKKVEGFGTDVVIASGHEGGGHVAHEPVHTMVLLPEVVKAVKIPVVAAGGISDGSTLAAALALGAVGVQMGTRFIATKESDFHQPYKDYVVNIKDVRDTILAKGLFGKIRYMKNPGAQRLWQAEQEGASETDLFNLEMAGFAAIDKGDIENSGMAGGEVAGRISDIPTVKELMERIVKEAEDIIRDRLPKFIA